MWFLGPVLCRVNRANNVVRGIGTPEGTPILLCQNYHVVIVIKNSPASSGKTKYHRKQQLATGSFTRQSACHYCQEIFPPRHPRSLRHRLRGRPIKDLYEVLVDFERHVSKLTLPLDLEYYAGAKGHLVQF